MFKHVGKFLSISFFSCAVTGCSFFAQHPQDIKEIEGLVGDAIQTVISKNADGFPEARTIRPVTNPLD